MKKYLKCIASLTRWTCRQAWRWSLPSMNRWRRRHDNSCVRRPVRAVAETIAGERVWPAEGKVVSVGGAALRHGWTPLYPEETVVAAAAAAGGRAVLGGGIAVGVGGTVAQAGETAAPAGGITAAGGEAAGRGVVVVVVVVVVSHHAGSTTSSWQPTSIFPLRWISFGDEYKLDRPAIPLARWKLLNHEII